MLKEFRLALISVALALVWVFVAGRAQAQQEANAATARVASEPPATSAGFDASDCKACHDPAFKKFETTPHAAIAQSCSACHGDVTQHLKSNLERGEPGPIISVKSLKADEANKICLTCHDKGKQANWDGGAHERRGVACVSCHSVHSFKSTKGQLKTAQDAEGCASCHAKIRSKSMRVSHHPVREGVMSCSSCHNPHDSTKPKLLSADFVNEQCLSCHAEKRGPFLWEHAPVRENCLHCHDPHGSNHEKLLVAKQPYLCQRCHLNTRHPGTLYDGINAVAGARVSNRAIEHACRNCHQNIHGGNAPSGPYLGR